MKNQFKILAFVAILLLTLEVCIASSIGANTLLGAANAAPLSIAAIAVLFRPNPTPPPFVPPTPVVNYLTFTAQHVNSSVGFLNPVSVPDVLLQYSTDNGATWNNYTFGVSIPLAAVGDNVMFKGNNDSFSVDAENFIYCTMEGLVSASGDVTSLLNDIGGDFSLTPYCFTYLFAMCTSLTQAPSLPATNLAEHCYENMFYNCTSLTQAPSLPATILAEHCYNRMFLSCKSLTQAPSLPATTLAEYCYENMFSECESLTQAPSLPATTLAAHCYASMFNLCTSLTQAPSLPATTLAEHCYDSMFSNCYSLTQAPSLPATTLAADCYASMFYTCISLTQAPSLPATTLVTNCYQSIFYGCTSLAHIEALFTTEPGLDYTSNWVFEIAQNGTFVKSALASWDVSGVNGIPNGWTVQTA